MDAVAVEFATFGTIDPPPATSAETAALWPHIVAKDAAILEKLPGGLVVFVFRGRDIELWRFEIVRDVAPASHDVLARSVARYGIDAAAVMVAYLEMIGDQEGIRVVVTSEQGGERTTLTQDLVADAGKVGRLVTHPVQVIDGPTWMGDGHVVPLAVAGGPETWEGAADA